MRKQKALVLIAVSLILSSSIFGHSFAHSGRTDDEGGHNSPDGYHYHHGYPAHQHENGECPYDFDDKTDHSTHSSNSKSRSIHSSGSSSVLWNIVIIFGIFFVSFWVPAIINVLRKSDKQMSGCLSWIIFFGCIAILSLLKW